MITGHHYQNAYICDDIEVALALFHTYADFADTPIYDVDQTIDTPKGPKRIVSRIALVWLGDLQWEFIQIISDETGLYANCRDNGGPLRFHHVAHRIDDWDAFRAQVDKQNWPLVMERAGDPHLKFLYLDARGFCGHYLEYVWCSDDRWKMMGGPPRGA